MTNLKDLANKARNRLLNKSLRDTYSNANSSVACFNMNIFNNGKNNKKENSDNNRPFKYLLREDMTMKMSNEDKERFILDTIRKYHEERRKIQKDIV